MKYEVTAVIYGRKIVEAESEEEIIDVAVDMGFDFNWDDLQIVDIKDVGWLIMDIFDFTEKELYLLKLAFKLVDEIQA